MFSAAIFDMDGLLLDSERIIMQAWLKSAGEEGLALAETDFLQVVGRGMAESHARLTELLGGTEPFAMVRKRVQARLLDRSRVVFPLKPGASAMLSRLQSRRVPCAVASSTRVEEVRSRLERVGILGFFQAVAGGDEVPRSKPDPAVYRLAAERLGLPPARCLAFEDSDVGALAAHAAGLAVVLIPDIRTFDFAAAYMRLQSLQEALDHVDRWFPEPVGHALA